MYVHLTTMYVNSYINSYYNNFLKCTRIVILQLALFNFSNDRFTVPTIQNSDIQYY